MKVVCAGVGVGGAMSAGGPRRAAASTCLVHTYSLSRSLNELRDGWRVRVLLHTLLTYTPRTTLLRGYNTTAGVTCAL